MQTCRANTIRKKGVPLGSTAREEILGILAVPTDPLISPRRLPSTQRTSNPGNFGVVFYTLDRNDGFGFLLRAVEQVQGILIQSN